MRPRELPLLSEDRDEEAVLALSRQRAARRCHDIFAAMGHEQFCARGAGSETMDESLFSFSATGSRAQEAAVLCGDGLEADLRTIKWPGQAQGRGATMIAATRSA